MLNMIEKPRPWLINDVSDQARELVQKWSLDKNKKFGKIVEELILSEFIRQNTPWYKRIFR
jgi:hypothetical protein